jgi:membrane-bound inhibitor of C-type lysozyme
MHKYISGSHSAFPSSCYLLSALFGLVLSGCGGVDKYNPFSESEPPPAYRPANATEYQCENNKRFYVRMQDSGNAAWLIYPNREVNLDKASGGSGTRYTNGIAVLEINGTDATLNDGPGIAYTGCKEVVAVKK